MGFWDTNKINPTNLNRLGPLVDGIVGTGGQYTDLYAAMSDPVGPQWNRVFVTPGATLNTDLAKSSVDNGCIIGVGNVRVGGTGKISLTDCSEWIIQNFRLTSTVTTNGVYNLLGNSTFNNIINCWAYNSGGKGIYIESGEENKIIFSKIYGAADHGIEIGAGVSLVWINECRVTNGAAWGILDNSNKAHILDCLVKDNATGQISGTNTYHSNNEVA